MPQIYIQSYYASSYLKRTARSSSATESIVKKNWFGVIWKNNFVFGGTIVPGLYRKAVCRMPRLDAPVYIYMQSSTKTKMQKTTKKFCRL